MPTLTLRPSADVSASGFTLTTGTAAYLMIDEAVADDATTQLSVSASTGTAAGSFTLPLSQIPTGAEITAVRVFARWYASVVGSGAASLTVGLTCGSAYTKPSESTPSSYTTQQFDMSAGLVAALNNSPTTLNLTLAASVSGSATDSSTKAVSYSNLCITQAYVEIDYIAVGAPINLQQIGETTTSVTLGWTASFNADTYNVYMDGDLLGTTAATHYTAQLDIDDNSYHNYSVVAVSAGGEVSEAATIRAAKEATYAVSAVNISAVNITPNPAAINQQIGVSVAVEEVSGYVTAEKHYCGEFYAGEV